MSNIAIKFIIGGISMKKVIPAEMHLGNYI